MQLFMAAASHVGRRKQNEDAWAVEPSLGLAVVSDGMGGYAGGEIASALAVDAVKAFVGRNRRDPDGTWPIRAASDRSFEENLSCAAAASAHREIATRREGPLRMMGATLVTALFRDGQVVIAHVGDSRAYLIREGRLTALTRDHSYYEELRAAGMQLPERHNFVHKNHITRALGIDGNAQADVQTFALRPDDVVLLCSDGLYDPVPEERLAAQLGAGEVGLAEACRAAVEEAYARGGTDNITAVAVRVSR